MMLIKATVIKVGVAFMTIHILRYLKQKLAWAINKYLLVISITMLFKTVIPLRI